MPLLTTACVFTFFLISFRCLLLALLERKPGSLRTLDFFAGALFLLCGLLMKATSPIVYTVGSMLILVVLALLILLPAIRRMNIPYRSRPGLAVLKAFFVICLFLFSIALLMMEGFQRFFEDQPVLKVTMTGISKQEDVEWKPPDFPLQHQKLLSYEVVVNKPDGEPVSELFLYGDQVAVKAKVIRFRPSLAILGVRSLCKIEYIYNGYSTAQRHNFYPHRAVEISTVSLTLKPWQERFWQYWEKLYYHQGSNAMVKTATLESTFFPLVDSKGQPFRGSYYLTVNAGGLSGTPTN